MRAAEGPFYDDRLHVLARKCSTCIFRPGNLMHLDEGRRDQMVDETRRKQSAIVCHDTTRRDDGVRGAICRGFWDVHRSEIWLLRLAEHNGIVDEVEPPQPRP